MIALDLRKQDDARGERVTEAETTAARTDPTAAASAATTPPGPMAPFQDPAPFSRWLTALGTLAIVALFAGAARTKAAKGTDKRPVNPLAAFDVRTRNEPIDRPLSQASADDAERLLRAAIADPKQSVAAARGARARLAVVLGGRGRWAQAELVLVTAEDGATFSRIVKCAYGPDRQACAGVTACDEATLATMTNHAGAWAAGSACVAAARQTGALTTVTRLLAVRSHASRVPALAAVLNGTFLLAGLVAGVMLLHERRRRRPSPQPPRLPPLLPAPWPLGDLYAALLRCVLWSLILSGFTAAVLSRVHVPVETSMSIMLYVVGFWWVVRLVFRRWGLSWRDSLRWPRGGVPVKDVALTLVAAIGFERGGRLCIVLATRALGGSVPRSDLLQPVDPASMLRLAATVIGTVALPALIEELVFRRVLFSSLRRRYAPATAALASAALFALIHGYSPVGSLIIFWLGLITAWAFNRTGNLWPSIATHAFGNAMVLLTNLL